jgi:hypothetical protein
MLAPLPTDKESLQTREDAPSLLVIKDVIAYVGNGRQKWQA